MKKKIKIRYSLLLFTIVTSILNSCISSIGCKDFDGNSYKTIKIGNQIWMAENLRTTKYRNGDPIPNVINDSEWRNRTSGALCDYDNGVNSVYGKLYNWYAVNDSRNIAPLGWHVPTDIEWSILIDYLGGENHAGGKMKEIGTVHWSDPNVGATNISGFNGLPAGIRSYDGMFVLIGINGGYWSSTQVDFSLSKSRDLFSGNSVCSSFSPDKRSGLNVRCLKD